jgi:4-hydroxybenzoate polyprenyltransferase
MQKQCKALLDAVLFSNLFIATAAAAQVAFTYQLIGAAPNLKVIGLVFCATLALYSFSMLMAKPSNPLASPFKRVSWIFSNQSLFITLGLMAAVYGAVLSLSLNTPAQILLILLGLIAISYNLPLYRLGEKRVGLRNLPAIKFFLVALVWTFSVVLLPVLELQNTDITPSLTQIPLLIAQRLLLISAIVIPFDVRDIYQDQIHQLKTIPVVLGEKKAYRLCFVLLLSTLLFSSFISPLFSLEFIAISITILISFWLIFKYTGEKNEYYYFFFLDGLLILPWLLFSFLNPLI